MSLTSIKETIIDNLFKQQQTISIKQLYPNNETLSPNYNINIYN